MPVESGMMPATTPELWRNPSAWRHRMKRTALAFIQAVDAAQYFREEFFRLSAAGEQMAMISVRGEEIVVGIQAGKRRHAGRFLADIQMVVAAEHALVVQPHEILFEVADDEHPAAQLQQIFSR